MATLTQGSPLPNITTTTTQQTNAPSFYNDYLSNLANQGAAALNNATFAGATPLQTQAFNTVGQLAGNYQPQLDAASQTTANANPLAGLNAANPYLQAGTNPTYNTVGNYLNPYTQDVVDQIGRLGEQNIERTVAPGAAASAVGSGQFGSQRGAQVLGQSLTDAQNNILAQQANALQTGYGQALTAAQAGNQNALNAGSTAGQLASQGTTQALQQGQQQGALAQTGQAMGLNDVNALATLGGQQQQINQAQSLFPYQNLTDYKSLLSGLQIPTSTTATSTGPGSAGQYGLSTLAQLGTLGSTAGGVLQSYPQIAQDLSSLYNSSGLSSVINNAGTTLQNAGSSLSSLLGFKEGGLVSLEEENA